VQFNFKNVSFEQYLTHVSGSHAFFKHIMSNEEYAEAYIWIHVMWRVSYIYHDCFIESKQLLQNVLCVAPANVVTLSWDVPADAGLLCNRAAMLCNMMQEALFVLPLCPSFPGLFNR